AGCLLGSMLVALAATIVVPAVGRACCNVIPQVARGFRGTRGIVDRPFARPGDWIEVRPECAAGLKFDADREGAYVVTILFETNGSTHVTVLSRHCDDGVLDDAKQACSDRSDVRGRFECIKSEEEDVLVVNGNLLIRFPDTQLAGSATIAVTTTSD